MLVGYLPGLTMRRVANLHPGEAKTDARESFSIAETARTMPTTLRSIKVADEQVAQLSMLCGFDDDLAAQITQTSNRVRGLLTQIHPTLERVHGPRLDHPAILHLLQKYPSPALLRQAGVKRVGNQLRKQAPRKWAAWASEIFEALGQQTVTVVGTDAAALALPRLARQLIELRTQRAARFYSLRKGEPDQTPPTDSETLCAWPTATARFEIGSASLKISSRHSAQGKVLEQ